MTEILSVLFSVILVVALAVQVYEDIKEGYLFDKVSLALAVVGLGRAIWLGNFLDACCGFLLGAVLLGILYYCTEGGMGLGDVFLAAAVGFWLGLWPGVVMILVAFILGGGVAVVLLLSGKGRKTAIPFAPFIAVGTLVAYHYGREIIGWYFRMFI